MATTHTLDEELTDAEVDEFIGRLDALGRKLDKALRLAAQIERAVARLEECKLNTARA